MRRLVYGLPLLCGCLLGPAPDTGPQATYDAVWSDFDAHYGLFGVKEEVDWDETGEACAALLPADGADDDALLASLQCMLAPLRDDHVRILRPGVEDGHWSAGRLEDLEMNEFSEELSGAWIDGLEDAHPAVRWGWLSPELTGTEEARLGYLHIRTLSTSASVEGVDAALADLSGADGIVVDLRGNGGGYANVLEPVASRFSDRSFVYARLRRRVGEERTAYGDWLEYRVEPGESPYLGPVVLLTHPWTVSGAEHLTLALRELDHVTHVGTPTAGAFSAAVWRDAPNGWLYALSVEDVRDVEGVSHEAIGVMPDVEAASSLEESREGMDRALEAAVGVLLDGGV